MRFLWRAYVVLGGLGLAAGLLPPSPDARAIAYQVLAAVALAALVTGIVGHRPRRRLGWWLLVVGFSWFYLGDLVFSVYTTVFDVTPAASLADVFYLAGYPFVTVGLLRIVHPAPASGRDMAVAGRDVAGLLDVAILTTGLCVFGWIVVIDPAFDASPEPLLVKLLAVAYPLADVPVLAVVVRLLLGRAHRTAAFRLLLGSLAVMTVADVLFAVPRLQEAHALGSPAGVWATDGLYLVSWFLLGAAGLHRSMRALSEPRSRRRAPLSGLRLAALAVASLAVPLALLSEALRTGHYGLLLDSGGGLVVALLVFARLAGLVATAERVQEQRRKLLERLMWVSEEERSRIAVEIHDGPLQVLAQLNFELERARRMLARGELERGMSVLGQGQERLRDEIHGLRRLMVSLRPPALDEVGLDPALRDWLAQFERRTGIRSELRADVGRLDRPLETTIYRAVQETLTGTITDSGATSVVVVLHGDDRWVELEVHDDGLERAATSPAGGGLLVGVRERIELAGGSWTVGNELDGRPRVAARFHAPGPVSIPADPVRPPVSARQPADPAA
jgi:signal transduction histidine kinase